MRTVFVSGAFDVIHRGHIELLHHARNLGDRLVVAIDSDFRVTSMKGPDRPYHTLADRIAVVEAIRYVDEVCVFGSYKDLEGLIRLYAPETIVVGSDWKGKTIIGGHLAGGVTYFDRIRGHSTTEILTHSADR